MMRRFAPFLLLAALLAAGCSQFPTITVQPSTPAPATPQQPAPAAEAPAAFDPQASAQVHTELASLYFQAGDPKTALDEANFALRVDPNYIQAYSVRGLIYASLKENAKANEDFQRALRLAPKDPDVNNNYGWYLCEIGRTRESITYFMAAVSDPLYRTPERAYANAGTCALRAGDFDGAQRYLLQAVQVSRDGAPAARLQLAQLFYQRGNFNESRIYLTEALRAMEPPPAEALWLAVRIERRLGNQQAEAAFTSQLRSRYPTSPEYQEFLKGNFQ